MSAVFTPRGALAVRLVLLALALSLATAIVLLAWRTRAYADSLVVPGPGLRAPAHALAHALNAALGATGRSFHLIDPPEGAQAGTLGELVEALEAGQVDTLVILEANPAYDAPRALGVPAALGRAALCVHAGLFDDETAGLSDWHLPLTHAYERWGDALAHDGTASLQQPSIQPLYDTRSSIELLALLVDDPVRDGRGLVRRQWQATHGGEDFEDFWRRSVRAAFVAGSAAPALALAPPHAAAAAAFAGTASGPTSNDLVALFAPDPSAHDGAYANNGWLQELPRPFTKIAWENALLVGPRTAARLGLVDGGAARAQVGAFAIERRPGLRRRRGRRAAGLDASVAARGRPRDPGPLETLKVKTQGEQPT